MRRVAIFGVGLIGGSFALALRRAGFTGEITGVSSPQTIKAALAAGVIDRGADGDTAARECDFVYLSQPVLGIIRALEQYGAVFRNDAIVTDAGSTKAQIAETARAYVKKALFVGGHPMAGKERRGVQESDAALFEGRKYILTPLAEEHVGSSGFQTLSSWIEMMGAVPVILNADEHDRLVAYTSHVPQLLSTALASVLSEVEAADKVAGPAVLELTRLALSPFDVWYDIFSTNTANIQAALTDVTAKLESMKEQLKSEALGAEFARAAAAARKLREKEFD
jgi:prephenate dehydrogenase